MVRSQLHAYATKQLQKEDGKVNIVMADDKRSFNANGTTYTRQ